MDIIYNEIYIEKLTFLKEVSIAHPFHAIPMDIKKNSLLLFYQELLMKLLHHANAPDEELFDFIKTHLLELEATEELTPDFHIVFLVQLIRQLGYAPELNFSIGTPYFSIEDSNFVENQRNTSLYLSKEASFYLFMLFRGNRYSVPDKKTRMELLNGMILYLMKYHKQIKEIESIAILAEVLV